MELGTSESSYPGSGDLHIPIDLFGSKKHAGVPRGVLAFADASGNIVFTVSRHPPNPNSSPPPKDKKLLIDASGNPIFSIYRLQNGSWKCYKGNSDGDRELVFRVQRILKTLTRVELEVFFDGERLNNEGCDLKVRGSPFKRSCSIYKDADLVAQASLMYKLHQLHVSRVGTSQFDKQNTNQNLRKIWCISGPEMVDSQYRHSDLQNQLKELLNNECEANVCIFVSKASL
ncbi:Tubby-like, C-terminal [Sesbania bispinosa]|nr:Tubby-like, C-terminal [Sesbania bispinosa]